MMPPPGMPRPARDKYEGLRDGLEAQIDRKTERIEGLSFGTRGGMVVRRSFSADGEYKFSVQNFGLGKFFPGEELEFPTDNEVVRYPRLHRCRPDRRKMQPPTMAPSTLRCRLRRVRTWWARRFLAMNYPPESRHPGWMVVHEAEFVRVRLGIRPDAMQEKPCLRRRGAGF